MSEDASDKVYAVRLAGGVARTIASEYERLEELTGPMLADRWRDGILDTIQSLATLPERCVIARENPLYQEGTGASDTIRQIIYQRRRGGPAWRLLFTVHEADENDPPTIWVRHIRHGAQEPMAEWPLDDGGA